MIGGNPNDFLDRIYSCQDTIYIYKGIKYWFQGYMPDSNTVHMEVIQYQPANNKEIWSHDAATIEQCKQALFCWLLPCFAVFCLWHFRSCCISFCLAG